ncbi:MAG: glycosyltransferase family 4 protein [Hyphomicrobiales bacterium]|nr:glycosyltransferase family 4 protein [Hyphomicrobiales bacterium]
MQPSPLRIACIADTRKIDANWVWIKDKLNYRRPLAWQFYQAAPFGPIDRYLGYPLIGRFAAGWRLRRAVKKGEIDVIVTHFPAPTAWMSLLLLGVRRKVVHLAYAFNFTNLPSGFKRKQMARLYRRVDRFVIFSNMERQLYADHFGIPEDRFERIAWGSTSPLDQPGPRQIDSRYVVSMGGEARDYANLVTAARAMTDTVFVLIVKPANLSGLELPPNVKVFTSIPWIDAWSLVFYADLAVIPLRSDVTPNGHVTLVGGMHLGKAHVVTNSSGLTDYVTNGETALMVPAGDATAMRTAIESLLSNPGLANRLGSAAKAFAEVNCGEEAILNYFANFLDRLPPKVTTPLH